MDLIGKYTKKEGPMQAFSQEKSHEPGRVLIYRLMLMDERMVDGKFL